MLYFLALVCLSTSAIWAKLNHMPSEVLGFWRLALASLILIALQLVQKKLPLLSLNRKNSWIFISGFFFFLHLWTFKYAAKHTLVANTMILFATTPIWSSLGALVFFKEKIARRVYFSYVIALLGILNLVYASMNFAPEQTAGNVSALISAVFYAAYMLTGKKARQAHDNLVYSTYQYLTCAVFFLIICLFTHQPFIAGYDKISWGSVVLLVLLPTFLGHFLLTHLVKTMNMAILSCGKLFEPIIASVMAYLLFRETLSSSIYISFLLTVISVLTLFWPQIKKYFSGRFKKGQIT